MKAKITFYSTLTAVAVLTAVAAFELYRTFESDNVRSDSPTDGVVKIDRDADYGRLCEIMTGSGVLRNPATFLRAARLFRLNDKFHPGRYVFTPGMNNREIIRTIAYGLQKPVDIVVGDNIRTMEQLASCLARQTDCDSAHILQLLRDTTIMANYGFSQATFPGMFIPDTYEVYWTIKPDNLLTRMYREYENFWKNGRDRKASDIGLSRNEVSTLASIVSEETKCIDEMPVVAGLYINRLRKGMPLQADPTVKFAVGDPALTRILNSHLQTESPYNTYKYTGLPPGPIVIPPVAAIDAVLSYEHHGYLYMCAKPTFDGRHSFAATYQQHLQNAARYHAAYEEMRKARQALADSLAAAQAIDSIQGLAARL